MHAERFVVSALCMDFFGFDCGRRAEEVLLELEVLSERETFWNVPRSTGVVLAMVVNVLGARNVLEIGTSNGYSGIFLADALSHTGGRLYTVESHAERFALARENFERAGVSERVHQLRGHAPEVLDELPADVRFDLVFLDATKMEYEQYLEAVLPFLVQKGLLVADNVVSHEEDMRDFPKTVQDKGLRSLLLEIDNGLLLCARGL